VSRQASERNASFQLARSLARYGAELERYKSAEGLEDQPPALEELPAIR
jgi:hypothetical protein